MNDPSAQPIDIEEQRNWIIDQRQKLGLSWAEMAKRTGIAAGTISQFGSERGYGGDEQKVAESVFRYRQYLAAQSMIAIKPLQDKPFFETETSRSLTDMLHFAQAGGEIVAAATGAGLGKTQTAKRFKICFTNVFHVTMKPSTAGVNNMQIEVLAQLGEKNAVGTPQKLTHRILELLEKRTNPLLILDEAQHLSEKSFDEIRSWNDEIGVAIALFGNIKILQRLEGGGRQDAFAQLFSRLSLKMVRPLPLKGDIDALAQAWDLFDERAVAMLHKVCSTPGGLRNGSKTLKIATMLSMSERTVLTAEHLQDAWMQLSSRAVMS